jgi:hypothetical protein
MKKLIIYVFLLLVLPTGVLAQTTVTVGSGGDYSTLSLAFTAINEGNLPLNPPEHITLQIISSITETDPVILYQTGYNGTAVYTSVLIYPTGSGYTIDRNFDGPLIDFNGASNVTLDGRVNQSGAADLIITNSNTGSLASTIRFIESANTNTIEYCIIKGSGTGLLTSGVVFFSTASLDGSIIIGNNSNTIDRNLITGNGVTRPVNAILSSGSSKENSGNIISNNNIYDFFNTGFTSNGINIDAYTTDWTISGNSFYETSSFVPTGALSPTYNVIRINNTSGTGFSITGNNIGGSSALCSGTWSKTNSKNNVFYGIYLNAGTALATSIQNNTIKNITWSNSGNASWTGIHIAGGTVNIGTTTGNILGSATGTGSVTITGGANNTNVYGINIAAGGTVNCQNNIIGSITAINGANSINFFGINKTATAGTTTINNNLIGSLTQVNSIYANSTSTLNAQSVFGISNEGTGSITIDGNTIANLTNGTTNATAGTPGLINGISSIEGTDIISNNVIHDLTISNANTSQTNTASVCGICLTGSTLKTITGNEI